MSEIIDRIPGVQSAIAALHGVADFTQQIKARQRLTGRSGQLAYAVQSPALWDLTETLPVPGGSSYSTIYCSIVYTGNGMQDYPIVIPSTDVRINGTGEGNRLSIVPSSGLYVYNDGSCDVIVQSFELPDATYFSSRTQIGWRFSLTYSGNVTIRIKARGQATSPGVFSVTRLP